MPYSPPPDREGSLLNVTVIELLLAVPVVVFAAAVQGTVGIGFNIVAVPIMSLINPVLAPVPQLIMSLPQTAGAAYRERGEVDRTGVFWILVGRLPGAAIGIWLLAVATDRLLDVLIGILVLTAVFILAGGVHLRRTKPVEFGTGVFAGVSSYVATIGGPPVALLYSRAEGATVRSTLGVIFFVGISITVVARTLAGDISMGEVLVGLGLLPAAGVGFLLSSTLKERTRPDQLRRSIFLLSSLAAIALLLRAAIG